MIEQDSRETGDEDDEADADDEDLTKIGGLAPAAAPKKRGRRKKSSKYVFVTNEFWIELRALYEGGNYTQRQLSDYAHSRGINLSQSRIARRAIDEGWIKGASLERLREEIHQEITKRVGDEIRSMLERHTNQARVIQAEATQHFKRVAEQRKLDPTYVMPPQMLATITQVVNVGQQLEAQALGWDQKHGKVFDSDQKDDAENRVPELGVKVYSDEEEEEIRRKSEEGLGED